MVTCYFSLSLPPLDFNIRRKRDPMSAKEVIPSTPRETPVTIFVVLLQVSCEGMLELSVLARDVSCSFVPFAGPAAAERGERVRSIDSFFRRCSSFQNSTSRGSIHFGIIYTSPLDSEIFMIKESMCMSFIIAFRLEIESTNDMITKRDDSA